MIEEHRVHSLTNRVIASEREAQVTYTARHVHLWHLLVNGATSLYECSSVVIMLWHTSCHSKYVRVENDILAREIYIAKQLICPACHFHFSLVCVCLSFLVKEHNDRCSTHRVDISGFLQELLLTLFQRDRVDDALALNAL